MCTHAGMYCVCALREGEVMCGGVYVLLYSRKYWRSLNLAVWPQTEHKKYWWNLNLAVAPRSVLRHHKRCTRVYQGALPSSCVRYLN